MARPRGFSRQDRGPKRLTNWGLGPGSVTAEAFAASTAAILGSGITFGAAGTIVRIRGEFSCMLTSFTGAGDGFQGAVGIGIASSAAFTAGIASLPTPLTEAAWDGWMWHRFFGCRGNGTSPDGVGLGSFRAEIDSKAMRKVSDEMTMFAVAEVVETGTASMLIFLDTRALLKEG